MHTSELTPAVLDDLRRPRPYPAVSLLMPTHRTRPDNEQDPIRLRNLLGEAAQRIKDDPAVDRDAWRDLDAQLDEGTVLRLFDAPHAEDGLLVLLAPGEQPQAWQLVAPSDVPERVEVTSTFLTRNLVAAYLHARPYWVLVLDLEQTRLYRAYADRLYDATSPGFPAEPQIPSREDALPGPVYGKERNRYRSERVRQYLTDVDERLTAAMAQQQLPLILAGSPELVAGYEKVSRHAGAVAGRLELTGSDKWSVPELEERLAPVFREARDARTEQSRRDLDAARSRKAYVAGVGEVWDAVMQHRAGLVVVEQDIRAAGRVTAGDRLELVALALDEPIPDDVATDIVDSIVEAALDGGAEVRFVPDGTLPDNVGIAAALRY